MRNYEKKYKEINENPFYVLSLLNQNKTKIRLACRTIQYPHPIKF